ncbi:LysM peptidoglycan-binding domain-containing protein [Arthrobacter sp. B1I2]|uniref:LysM peptidoglycan-binding domain-containing protein n=1 Tax=Arthrobacter sp. B1I2 TaxID=3042263 RepID=UPI00278871D8|nr:LysM domain-containing protein [Arthrobacter sp. B1I2]MDQ0731608.1 nucleoid-associated protein YgaU [Arthrobacter sp. B1I2]
MAYFGGKRWSDAVTALALLALGILLCFLGAGLLAQWQESTARHQDTSMEVLLAAATAAAGIGLLLWWAFSILSASAAVLLERLGRRRAAAAARRLSPAFMQRAVVAALSMQLMAGAAANASAITPGPEWTPTQDYSSSAPSHSAAPENAQQHTAGHGPYDTHVPTRPLPAEAPLPAPDGQAPPWESGSQPPAITLSPGWQPARPVVDPGLLAAPEARTTAGSEMGGRDTHGQVKAVTVLAGDTLWDIVATYLGPDASDVDIALEWPRWYAANRALIGGCPDVLLPGQILQAPAA